MSKKLTVIIPVYNAEKWIADCLESLLRQTFQDFEAIIVNDGSTDNSLKVIKSYSQRDNRLNCISTKNRGSAMAKNLGLRYASGKLITFLDADDYIDEMMYETMVSVMDSSKADIVECGCRKINNYGRVIQNIDFSYEIISGRRDCAVHFMKQKNVGNYMCNKIYRRKLFSQITFPCLSYSEDYYVNGILHSKIKKKIILPQIFYNYRIHSKQCTGIEKVDIKRLDGIKAGNMASKYYSYDKELKTYGIVYACNYALMLSENIYRNNISVEKIFWKKMDVELMKTFLLAFYGSQNTETKKRAICQAVLLCFTKKEYIKYKWLFET